MTTPRKDAATPEPPEKGTDRDSPWTGIDLIALSAVTVFAALLRLWNLAHPDELIFDETYYAKDACWYVESSQSVCDRGPDTPEVHPPLGKWLIAVGVRIFGFDSFGWRVSAAVAGIVTVALLFILARKLLRSTLAATIASGLLALDFLHLVQSRTSMLDIFIPLFGVAGFLFLVYDRDRLMDPRANERSLFDRPWRLAAGACFGAAVATKWSGVLVLVGGLCLAFVWEVGARRARGGSLRRALGGTIVKEMPSIAIYMVAVPVALYLVTYIGRLEGSLIGAPWAQGHWVRSLWDHHDYMLGFHGDLASTHSYQSPPWTWLLLKRPVSYYFCSDKCVPPNQAGDYEEIFAAGSPFVWWMAVLALAFVAYRWARTRDLRGPEGLILAGFAFTYLPWFWLARDRAAVFLFYLVPTVPFMCLALAYVATRIGRSWEAKSAIALFATGTLGVFLFYLPLLVARPLPQPEWQSRIWVFDNCDKPPGEVVTTSITETVDGELVTRATETSSDTSSVPPTGWCWI